MKLYWIPGLLVGLLTSGCSKTEEANPLDISGSVTVYTWYPELYSDQSGVSVTLMMDEVPLVTAVTSAKGRFTFKGVPYGSYNFSIEKPGFAAAWESYTFLHQEGDATTPLNFRMFSMPDYQITIDSVDYTKGPYALVYHLRINGDTLLPPGPGFPTFIGYFNKTRSVSATQYIATDKGYLANHDSINPSRIFAVKGKVYMTDINIDKFTASDSFFVRLYPLADGQGLFPDEFNEGALGNGSNVYGFKINP